MQQTGTKFPVPGVGDGEYDYKATVAHPVLERAARVHVGANRRSFAVLRVSGGVAHLYYDVKPTPVVDRDGFVELDKDIEVAPVVVPPVRDTDITAGLGNPLRSRPMESGPPSAPTEQDVAIATTLVDGMTFDQLKSQARELNIKGWQLFKEAGLRKRVAEALS